MWKAKVWIEGKWLWFTSDKATIDDAEQDVLDQAKKFFEDWRNKSFDDAVFIIELIVKE